MFVNLALGPMRTYVRIGLHRSPKVYQPNKVMIWTDTFANNKQSNIFSTELGENNARLAMLNRQDIRVIVGNPPYSVGQESANDDNQTITMKNWMQDLRQPMSKKRHQATRTSFTTRTFERIAGLQTGLAIRV